MRQQTKYQAPDYKSKTTPIFLYSIIICIYTVSITYTHSHVCNNAALFARQVAEVSVNEQRGAPHAPACNAHHQPVAHTHTHTHTHTHRERERERERERNKHYKLGGCCNQGAGRLTAHQNVNSVRDATKSIDGSYSVIRKSGSG